MALFRAFSGALSHEGETKNKKQKEEEQEENKSKVTIKITGVCLYRSHYLQI